MKVIHWNFFNSTDKQSGVKRYEDELFKNMNLNGLSRIVPEKRDNYYKYLLEYNAYDADIVHTTFQVLSPLKILKHPKKFVLTVHDIIPTTQYSTIEKLKHMWYLSEHCIQYADKIITISEFTKQELIDNLNINEDKIHVVQSGIDHNLYRPSEDVDCKKIFNLDPNKKHILIVSSNEPWKNMKLANEIIDELGDEYQFVKIGYGQKLNNPKVINLGYISEIYMPWLYNACDLFVHTSLYEGFGFPVLEAQACGCPVVSSRAASLPEVVKHSGFLLANEKRAFVDSIRYILENEHVYKELQRRGIENAKNFTWEKTAKETIEVYKTLL